MTVREALSSWIIMRLVINWLENVALWIAGAALLLMGTIVTASVVGRVVFTAPVPDDLVMVGLLMVGVIILPLAFIERTDGHIAVTVITDHFPVRVQFALKALGNLLFGLFFGVMGVMLAKKVPSEISEHLYYDGHFEIPTWPMKALFAMGVAIFVARLLFSFFGNLQGMVNGVKPAGGESRASKTFKKPEE